MLRHLHIQNYALISHLDIDFAQGFSAITGETGAGKSIILGALGLVMGGRADTKTITEGEQRCVIEAEFDGYLIRRELNVNGRSRSLVNDEVVTQAELKSLAAKLLDIHSQHESLLIANDDFQLGIVDSIAKDAEEKERYYTLYKRWQETIHRLRSTEELAIKSRRDRDYIAFQYKQLEDAKIDDEGELESLQQEEYDLLHVEEKRGKLEHALQVMNSDDMGALTLIHSAVVELHEVEELGERLHSVEVDLKDIIAEAERMSERLEFNPGRLQEVQDRLDILNSLLRKHNKQTLCELMSYRDEIGEQLNQIDSFDEQIIALQKEADDAYQQTKEAANILTDKRKSVVQGICDRLVNALGHLNVKHAKVDIAIEPLEELNENGQDFVQFLFAANLNQSLRRVSEVASGGEISRLMLCIKALIASSNGLPTILFDEIDTGVSGETATQMGKIMREMAQSRQIIAITHLPQIAALAETQYCVYKSDTETRTETNIHQLNHEERVQELASMLAGKNITDAVLNTARQLLQ